MALARFRSNNSGFSLMEVVVSMGLLSAVSLGVAQLFAVSSKANLVARGYTSTTAMAEQKMEQLRSLTWGFDLLEQGLPLSDTTSNLSYTPPQQNGSGLNPSPTNALDQNVSGYFDYLDATGGYVGTGTTAPTTAVYVRRWSIQPLPTNPNNTIILQVLVTPVVNERARQAESSSPARTRLPGDSLLTTVKTRKAS